MKTLFTFLLLPAAAALHAGVDDSLKTLAAVKNEGRGNEAASAAWAELVKAGPAALPPLLKTAGTGSAVADNWVRLAGDAIVEQALRAKQPLPLDAMEKFARETEHAAGGRQLAFDLLQRADPARAGALEPSLLNDPVQELRRGAVQRIIDSAKGQPAEEAKAIYLQALGAVRDEDQTKFLAAELKKSGVAVDLPKHFGFLMNWHVIGPFDNTDEKGFDAVYPPEKELRLEAAYPGKSGEVKWQPFTSKDEYGKLDFNKPLGMQKAVTAYALTTIDSPEERDAELRLGCKNGWKVWLNGQLLFGRDEYHRGQQMDQYKMKARLKKGANTLLVKCCQDEQKQEWTVEWEFQLRVCDSAGTAILAAQ